MEGDGEENREPDRKKNLEPPGFEPVGTIQ
jgi:hypothetical protein